MSLENNDEYTTIEAELAALKDGETLVVVTKDKQKGYWIGIGDNIASNVWVITQAELDKLAGLLDKHRSDQSQQ